MRMSKNVIEHLAFVLSVLGWCNQITKLEQMYCSENMSVQDVLLFSQHRFRDVSL